MESPFLCSFWVDVFFRTALHKSFVDLFLSSLWGLPSGLQGPPFQKGLTDIGVPNFSVGAPSGTPKAYKFTPMAAGYVSAAFINSYQFPPPPLAAFDSGRIAH